MPLQKTTVSVNFSQGVDTKTDPKSVLPGKLLVCENGVFQSPRRIKLRNGYEALSNSIGLPTTGFMREGQALATFQGELLAFDETSVYSWNSSVGTWFRKGGFTSVSVDKVPVVRNSAQQTSQDSTSHPSGLQVFAWEDSRGGSHYSVIDSATGQTVVTDALIAANAIKPKVLSIANQVVLLWVNAADFRIYGAVIPVTNPTAVLAPIPLTSSAGDNRLNASQPNYDATVVDTVAGEQLYVAYNNSMPTPGGHSVIRSVASNPLIFSEPVNQNIPANAITVFPELSVQGPIVAVYDGTRIVTFAYDRGLRVLDTATIETLPDVVSLTGVSRSAMTLDYTLYYSVSAPQTYNYRTRWARVTGTYQNVGTPQEQRSTALFAKAFTFSGVAYAPLVFESPFQSTYFIQPDSGTLSAAKILYSVAGPIPARASNGSAMLAETNALPPSPDWRASEDGPYRFQIAVLEKGALTSQQGQAFSLTGVTSVSLNFGYSASSYLSAELGSSLLLGGGYLAMYDGASVTEAGFHVFPEPVTVTTSTTGGALAAGTYGYQALYEWTDNQGQMHRSAPSVAVSQTTTGDTSSNTITVPTLRLTSKQDPRAPVVINIYRTQADGTTYYQLTNLVGPNGTVTNPLLNSVTTDAVGFIDTVADASIIGNPLLPTTGGEVENVEPSSIGPMTVHRNRVFAITGPLTIDFSKEVVGSPVEFSSGTFTINVDPRGGPITALGSLDAKLVVFKRNAIFFIDGAGPDRTGGGEGFSDAVFITSEAGCTNARSVVLTSLADGNVGLMFQSAKGIYLLDRALRVTYIGADVEAYNDRRITSAQQIPGVQQIRFTLDTGEALVYDYAAGQWAVHTGINAVDSAIFQDRFVCLAPHGVAYQETPGSFTDAGRAIKLRLKTSWLQPAGQLNWERLYRAIILGEYASPHNLIVSVAYDFDETPVQTSVIAPEPVSTYGGESPFGAGSYGGAYPLYLYRVHLARQKATAFQFTIETSATGTPGEQMSISALGLEIGQKAGLVKVPATRSVG